MKLSFSLQQFKSGISYTYSRKFIVIVLGLFMILAGYLGYSIYQVELKIKKASRRIDNLVSLMGVIRDDNAIKDRFDRKLSHVDPLFVKQKIESIVPFESELNILEDVTKFSAFKGFVPIQERIVQLGLGEGAFTLDKVKEHRMGRFVESFYQLPTPVLVNESNLNSLLVYIEGKQWSYVRPQIFIKKLALHKVLDSNGRQAFDLDLELIQRDKHRPT